MISVPHSSHIERKRLLKAASASISRSAKRAPARMAALNLLSASTAPVSAIRQVAMSGVSVFAKQRENLFVGLVLYAGTNHFVINN